MANVLFFFVSFVLLVFLDPHVEGSRLSLTHVDSGAQLTAAERFRRAVLRSHSRRQAFEGKWSSPSTVVAAVNYAGEYVYVVDFGIGSPMLPATAILDTGSDLIWTQCVPCLECLSQPSPYYDPSKSYTFSPVPCSSPFCSNRDLINIGCVAGGGSGDRCLYLSSYGDGTESRGFLGTETFVFGDGSSIAGVTFGCGFWNNGSLSNSTGIVGMGRGPLSLPSQLNPRKFSYCLAPLNSSAASYLFLGSTANLGGNRRGLIGSTPLISSTNPNFETFYYLSLLGISLGGTRLPIPESVFRLKSDGSDGTIIDSGTFLTFLNQAGYDILREEIIKQVRKPPAELPEVIQDVGVDLCFSFQGASSLPPMPELVFHFEGADMRFPRDKYMKYVDELGLLCSVIAGTQGLSIFGNYQQQDMHILFDLEADVLSFVAANCDQL
ncbi:aspartic proteinase nepenthesin-1-like [Curcuma longa]|uniref:aspartic proteinase nepenthesin-1-like n=1 Tax=Curcuma longa TaxID=136217 RepID=UPI003D9EFA38